VGGPGGPRVGAAAGVAAGRVVSPAG